MSVYNTYNQLSLHFCISLLWLVHLGHSCIFFYANGYKAQDQYITYSQNVTNFEGDCELLCYHNPDSCIAGNVLRQADGSYMCQFVSLSVPSNYFNLLESNPTGRYFSHNDIYGKSNMYCRLVPFLAVRNIFVSICHNI